MTKAGRPKKDDELAKRQQIHLRVTAEQLKDINFVSEKLEVSRTDAVMLGIEKLKEDLPK